MTNEEYIKAIEMRRSRRTYRNVPLDSETITVVEQLVDAVNKQEEELAFKFIEDATDAFTVITGIFSVIAVCGADTERARIKSGYYGEMIVLQCVYHGLGTCWVTGTYNENKILAKLNLPRKTRLYGVIVIGNVKKNLSSKEKMFHKLTHKTNKPYQKMFISCDRKLPPYYEYAMKLVEMAPSETNRRPVDFIYENGIISGKVEEALSDKSVEFGIAQLHFRLGAAAKGVKGEWNMQGRFCTEDTKVIKFPENENNNEGE